MRPELLAPAGDRASVEAAIDEGADAVYVGNPSFSLRGKISGFSIPEIDQITSYVHKSSRKLYLAVNIAPRDEVMGPLEEFLRSIASIELDALIMWDPGVIWLAKNLGLHHPIHLSTMACTLNTLAAKFWKLQGISRVNLARELHYNEVAEIAAQEIVETEIFIHGSMCIAYAGRCVLSNYLRSRDTHRGLCATPCRWRYRLVPVEQSQSNTELELTEEESEAYILNSRNLCLVHRIPEILAAGVTAMKIEGRQHDAKYVHDVVRVYRSAIDRAMQDSDKYSVDDEWIQVLDAYGGRGYWEGFMFGSPNDKSQRFDRRGPSAKWLQEEDVRRDAKIDI